MSDMKINWLPTGDLNVDLTMSKQESAEVIDDLFESGAVTFTGLDASGNEIKVTLKVEGK